MVTPSRRAQAAANYRLLTSCAGRRIPLQRRRFTASSSAQTPWSWRACGQSSSIETLSSTWQRQVQPPAACVPCRFEQATTALFLLADSPGWWRSPVVHDCQPHAIWTQAGFVHARCSGSRGRAWRWMDGGSGAKSWDVSLAQGSYLAGSGRSPGRHGAWGRSRDSRANIGLLGASGSSMSDGPDSSAIREQPGMFRFSTSSGFAHPAGGH